MRKHFLPRPQQIFTKAGLGCFRLNVFLPYRFQGNKRKSKPWVAAKPEQQGDVESGLGEGVTGGTHLGRTTGGGTRPRDGGELGIRDVGKLGSVTNHLEVASLLLGRHGELVPDVHPVAVLAIDALATNLDLDLGDQLLTDVIQPACIDTVVAGAVGGHHLLVDLGESHLQVRAVAKVTITRDGAGHPATEVSLALERLLDGFHRKVGMAPVRHLPESNFRSSCEEHVLGTIGNKLKKTTSHLRNIDCPKKKNPGKLPKVRTSPKTA
jgi:hypothetical protein